MDVNFKYGAIHGQNLILHPNFNSRELKINILKHFEVVGLKFGAVDSEMHNPIFIIGIGCLCFNHKNWKNVPLNYDIKCIQFGFICNII